MLDYAYIPGVASASAEPLARYLPPIPAGVAKEWLHSLLPADGTHPWIIDPFGASPRLAVEAARDGWRILVTANNPVMRFLLEMSAAPPQEADFRASLAELASSFKGKERLEPHLRALYTIACANCGASVEVDAFLWEKGSAAPYGSLYTCPACSISGEHPLSRHEAEKATAYTASGLHWSRALERVAPTDDPDRVHVEEALEVYLPRSVYALFTLINRLDGLSLNPTRRMALQALLLSACDMANTLWSYPSERERPRQLVTPTRFREKNIWLALEEAISLWSANSSPVPLTVWPALPSDSGGICLYEGPLRDLAARLNQSSSGINIGGVLTALPRPNQAFWTLSALWSGWLWGREAVGPFKSVLRRRRYDWSWHYTALLAAFESLNAILNRDTPILGLIGEAEAGMLTAVLCAASEAGLNLNSLALRSEQAQIFWRKEELINSGSSSDISQLSTQSIQEFLSAYGQPAPFLPTWSSGLVGISMAGAYSSRIEATKDSTPAHAFSEVQNTLKEILTYRGGFLRYGSGEALENSLWWLRREPEIEENETKHPIADRFEIEVVKHLITDQQCTFSDLETRLLQAFPGLLTPDEEWLPVILDSYATKIEDETGREYWRLRSEDAPAARRTDLESMRNQLETLAHKTGFTQEGDFPVAWLDDKGQRAYWFYPIVSAVIANILLGKTQRFPSPPNKSLIILPGGRANLAAYKLHRDPRLKRLCQPLEIEIAAEDQSIVTGWRMVKLRHLRWLVDNVNQMQQPLDDLFRLDPLTFAAPQMRLL